MYRSENRLSVLIHVRLSTGQRSLFVVANIARISPLCFLEERIEKEKNGQERRQSPRSARYRTKKTCNQQPAISLPLKSFCRSASCETSLVSLPVSSCCLERVPLPQLLTPNVREADHQVGEAEIQDQAQARAVRPAVPSGVGVDARAAVLQEVEAAEAMASRGAGVVETVSEAEPAAAMPMAEEEAAIIMAGGAAEDIGAPDTVGTGLRTTTTTTGTTNAIASNAVVVGGWCAIELSKRSQFYTPMPRGPDLNVGAFFALGRRRDLCRRLFARRSREFDPEGSSPGRQAVTIHGALIAKCSADSFVGKMVSFKCSAAHIGIAWIHNNRKPDCHRCAQHRADRNVTGKR